MLGKNSSYIVFFLNFLGFYSLLLISANLNLLDFSRYLTIPIRLLIIILLIHLFLKSKKLNVSGSSLLFLLFSLLYVLRIGTDLLLDRKFFIPFSQVFQYYLAFVVIPFLIIKHIKFTKEYLSAMKRAAVHSSLLFSLLATVFYAKFFGKVGRLTEGASEDDLISPLILSYCSALIIGLCINFLLVEKCTGRRKAYLFVIMLLSLIPYFLGASRGSIISIALPILTIAMTNKYAVNNLKLLVAACFAFIILFIISDKFGSGIFLRFLNIFSDIESGNSSALRIDIWRQSIDQFLDYPILGDRMEVIGFNIYPHNLFIEVLQNLGMIGFIPFVCLVLIGFKECYLIFKNYRQHSWIGVIFLQSFAQNMFSGAIYNASWFWVSLALILNLRRSFKYFKEPLKSRIPL
jgi:hypothetical protein